MHLIFCEVVSTINSYILFYVFIFPTIFIHIILFSFFAFSHFHFISLGGLLHSSTGPSSLFDTGDGNTELRTGNTTSSPTTKVRFETIVLFFHIFLFSFFFLVFRFVLSFSFSTISCCTFDFCKPYSILFFFVFSFFPLTFFSLDSSQCPQPSK